MAGSSDTQIKNLEKQVKDLTKRLQVVEQKVKLIADAALKSSKDTEGLMKVVEKQIEEVEKKLKEKGGSMDETQIAKLMEKSSSLTKRFDALNEKSMEQYRKEGEKERKARDAEDAKYRKEAEKLMKADVERAAKALMDARLKTLEAQVQSLMGSRR